MNKLLNILQWVPIIGIIIAILVTIIGKPYSVILGNVNMFLGSATYHGLSGAIVFILFCGP
jgi:hypothetical protein